MQGDSHGWSIVSGPIASAVNFCTWFHGPLQRWERERDFMLHVCIYLRILLSKISTILSQNKCFILNLYYQTSAAHYETNTFFSSIESYLYLLSASLRLVGLPLQCVQCMYVCLSPFCTSCPFCYRHVHTLSYLHKASACMYSGTPLIRTPWNEDTSINRTLFAVPNAMFVYNLTRTPH